MDTRYTWTQDSKLPVTSGSEDIGSFYTIISHQDVLSSVK